jgi:hypothetical protein
MPHARFAKSEFTDLEKRIWFLEENSAGFKGTDNVWTVAYSTTLHQPAAPFSGRFRPAADGFAGRRERSVLRLTPPARFGADFAIPARGVHSRGRRLVQRA